MQKALEKYIAWGAKARKGGYFKASHKLASDHGRVMRQKERLVNVDGRGREHVLDIDTFVNRDGVALRHAIGEQHAPDGF